MKFCDKIFASLVLATFNITSFLSLTVSIIINKFNFYEKISITSHTVFPKSIATVLAF